MAKKDPIAEVIEDFWAYKPNEDNSPLVPSEQLFEYFSVTGDEVLSSAISAFAGIVHCPYRIVNLGMGNRPVFSRSTVKRMNAGTRSHREVETEIRQRNLEISAAGGPPDWRSAGESIFRDATQDLLEAPEVQVSLAIGNLRIRGKVDGLRRSDGTVLAVERKPRGGMFKPASILQAMSYAIGGCLALGSAGSSFGSKWVVTSYDGVQGPAAAITHAAVSLFTRLGHAYQELFSIGAHAGSALDLPGPGSNKCRRCEFYGACEYKVAQAENNGAVSTEPVWLKYKRKKKPRSES